jgi:uncharacterized membrane protein
MGRTIELFRVSIFVFSVVKLYLGGIFFYIYILSPDLIEKISVDLKDAKITNLTQQSVFNEKLLLVKLEEKNTDFSYSNDK